MAVFLRRAGALWVVAALLTLFSPLYTLAQEGGTTQLPPPPPSESSGGGGGGTTSGGTSAPTPPPPAPSTQPPQSQPPSSGGAEFQKDGSNFQPDGSNFQKDGSNFQKDGQNFQPGPNGQQPGEFRGGQEGMSEEAMEAMEKKRAEQDEKMKARQLKQMQRGMQQFKKMITRFKARMDKLAGQGVPIPAECKEGVEQAMTLVKSILEATDPDEVDPSDLQSSGEVMQVCGPKIERLAQLPRILKQVNNEITKLDKKYKSVAARAERANLDGSSVLSAVSATIAELKAAVEAIKTGGEDDAFEALEEMREKFEEAHRKLGGLDALFQMQKSLRSFNSQLARFDRLIKNLEKKGEGSEERAKLTELKNTITQLKGAKLTEDNEEEIMEQMQNAWQLRDDLEDALDIHGNGPSLFEFKGGPSEASFKSSYLDAILLEQKLRRQYLARSSNQVAVAGIKIQQTR